MRIDPRVRKVLDQSGLHWELSSGKGHGKLRVGGKLVGVMSTSPNESSQRKVQNTIAQIRRAAKEINRES